MSVVALGFAVLIHDRWGSLTIVDKVIAIGGFLAPVFASLPLAPLLLLVALHLQMRVARREIAPEPAAAEPLWQPGAAAVT